MSTVSYTLFKATNLQDTPPLYESTVTTASTCIGIVANFNTPNMLSSHTTAVFVVPSSVKNVTRAMSLPLLVLLKFTD